MAEQPTVSFMLFVAILTAALGMFQFGYHTGVINVPQKIFEKFIEQVYKESYPDEQTIPENTKKIIWSVIVSIFALGGMIGGYLGPSAADKFGRRNSLWANNVIALLAVSIMSFSHHFSSIKLLVLGRLLIGLSCGASTSLVPMYLSEIAPLNLRGAIGIVAQLAVTIGLFVSQVLGNQNQLGTETRWPFLFGFSFIPIVIQFVILPVCPESPRHLLLNRSQEAQARLALERLRSSTLGVIQLEIDEMKTEARAQEEEVRTYGGPVNGVVELFKHSWLREPLIIAMVMQLSQQLSGINAVFYYSTQIFLSADLDESSAAKATVGVGLIMVIMSIISIPLIDRLGRRSLHLTGLGGMFIFSITLTLSLIFKNSLDWIKYLSVTSVLLYTLFFATGPGSLPWMITSELFTQAARPAAVSLAVLVNWFANFAVGLSFPIMLQGLMDYIFVPYTLMIAIIWVYIYMKLPETKNRTFEEISLMFKHNSTNNSNKRRNYGSQERTGPAL